jgi:predicted nucleic acid-binding protein
VILLDTPVVAELMRPTPDRAVARWIARQPVSGLYTTAITQAAILDGLRRLPAGWRRDELEAAAEAMFRDDFGGRVLAFGGDAARRYAAIAADRARIKRPMTHPDAQIAAIAHTVGATLATRDLADYDHCDVAVMSPWG